MIRREMAAWLAANLRHLQHEIENELDYGCYFPHDFERAAAVDYLADLLETGP